MKAFKEGEIVQLKSGGPKMTIKEILNDGGFHCQWFAGSKLQEGYFDQTSVVKVEETNE